ncbi:MAG: divergent PAP2 family protein [Spirochaetaceae bacterium]|nr:MAG: divergent PAP2 family protein [Spirochaetaceae bacterium]
MSALAPSLLVALCAQVACQLFKVAFYSVRERRFAPRYFVSAGGIPSAHSAFVSALSVSVGIGSGFASDLFAVSAVFSIIVIYDSFRLRGQVQEHARRINTMQRDAARGQHPGDTPRNERAPLNEMVGHSLPEIAVGVAAGSVLALLATVLIPG